MLSELYWRRNVALLPSPLRPYFSIPQPRCFTTTSFRREVPAKKELRPYQEEAIQAVLGRLCDGERRLGLSLATGSGKTVIFSHLVDRVPSPADRPDATQTLILAHRKELVEQAARTCRETYPEKAVDIEMGSIKSSGLADITIASAPTLSRSPDRLSKLDPSRFKLVIVDEAHHIVAKSYMDILRHFSLVNAGTEGSPNRTGHVALIGVSATFARHDGLRLGAAIDRIVYHKDYVDMMEEGWLVNTLFTTVSTGVNLTRVKVSQGDFQTASLSKAVNTEEANQTTVIAWREKAGNRRSTLVFCVDIHHVKSLLATFRSHGVDARYVTGETTLHDRTNIIADFKSGLFPVLLNCMIFTEGTDIPNIDCIVLARPTQSRGLLIQMIGRGMRQFDGKEDFHVIDMVSTLESGIVTTPTLFGLDPEELLDGANVKDMASIRECRAVQKQQAEEVRQRNSLQGTPGNIPGTISFTDYSNVHDLLEDTSGERHIRSISRFAWVAVAEKKWILSNRDGAYIGIERKDDDSFSISYTARIPDADTAPKTRKPQLTRKRYIATDITDFAAAVRAADTKAANVFSNDYIATNAYWRKGLASAKQLGYLNKFRGEHDQLDSRSMLTHGVAGDMITKRIHGAKGRFNRMEKQKTQAAKISDKKEKWQERQKQSEVKVGPLASEAAHQIDDFAARRARLNWP